MSDILIQDRIYLTSRYSELKNNVKLINFEEIYNKCEHEKEYQNPLCTLRRKRTFIICRSFKRRYGNDVPS